MFRQRSIQNLVRTTGVGVHSGRRVELTLRPAAPNTGIVFRRVDIDPVVDLPASDVPPGTVVEASGRRLVIAAGRGGVTPQSVQPAGKRAMSTEEFLRGHRVRPGDKFFDLS